MPAGSEQVEIPWSTVRLLTDPAYGAHLAEVAEDEARQVGRRLRGPREARNLIAKELAGRAGITPRSLSRIEPGPALFLTRIHVRVLRPGPSHILPNAPPGPSALRPLFDRLTVAVSASVKAAHVAA